MQDRNYYRPSAVVSAGQQRSIGRGLSAAALGCLMGGLAFLLPALGRACLSCACASHEEDPSEVVSNEFRLVDVDGRTRSVWRIGDAGGAELVFLAENGGTDLVLRGGAKLGAGRGAEIVIGEDGDRRLMVLSCADGPHAVYGGLEFFDALDRPRVRLGLGQLGGSNHGGDLLFQDTSGAPAMWLNSGPEGDHPGLLLRCSGNGKDPGTEPTVGSFYAGYDPTMISEERQGPRDHLRAEVLGDVSLFVTKKGDTRMIMDTR